MSPPTPPETYTLPTIPHVPNSPLPVLLYRAVLPSPADPATARAALEANAWLQGGVFKAFTRHHFHSVTHECYAVVRGGSRLVLGVGPLDGSAREEGEKETKGVEVDVEAGDIIVMPVSPFPPSPGELRAAARIGVNSNLFSLSRDRPA